MGWTLDYSGVGIEQKLPKSKSFSFQISFYNYFRINMIIRKKQQRDFHLKLEMTVTWICHLRQTSGSLDVELVQQVRVITIFINHCKNTRINSPYSEAPRMLTYITSESENDQ